MLPSFRDLELRLQRITDHEPLARALRDGAAVIEHHGGNADEMHDAAARLVELHGIATALWHTVRSFGTPPAVPPKVDRRPGQSIHRANAEPKRPAVMAPSSPARTRVHAADADQVEQLHRDIAALQRTQAELTRAVKKLPVEPAAECAPAPEPQTPRDPLAPLPGQPAATLTLPQLRLHVGRSDPWVYQGMRYHGFPRPQQYLKARAIWCQAAVDRWLAAHPKAGNAERIQRSL